MCCINMRGSWCMGDRTATSEFVLVLSYGVVASLLIISRSLCISCVPHSCTAFESVGILQVAGQYGLILSAFQYNFLY